MGTQQDTLIYIDEKDKHDASAAANAFAHKDVKNRAYINTLGADLAMKYLASENIDISNVYNIHSIKKILEELDISDIMLPNIHIDVRVIFDENIIFIPKSHFEFNLVPDIYLVFNLAKDFSHVKFMGFFEPKLINKSNANKDYYFIEKEKLSPATELKHFIENFHGNTREQLSQDDLSNSERIIIAMADNDISDNDKKYLIKQLTKSAELRDKFIEYENFETLSYKAAVDPQIHREKPVEPTEETIIDNAEEETPAPLVNLETLEETNTNIDELNINSRNENTEPLTDLDTLNTLSDTGEEVEQETPVVTENTIDEIPTDNIDTSLDIVDSEIKFDDNLINTDYSDTPDIISLDDVDTTNIDKLEKTIDVPETEETISLDNIELPEINENTDYIDRIDNTISFDNVTVEPLNEEPSPDLNEKPVSLDDLSINENLESDNTDKNFDSDIVSLDDINNNVAETPLSGKVSVDDFAETPLQTDSANIDDFMDNEMSLDNSIEEMLDDAQTIDSADNTEAVNSGNIPDDDSIFDNIAIPQETSQTQDEQPETPIPPDTVDTTLEEEKNEGFGKNLLENLNSENLDDITIENIPADENSLTDQAQDISSNDLLSQIDDILNASTETQPDENTPTINEDNTQTVEQNTVEENTLPKIPEDLDSIPEIDELGLDNSSPIENQQAENETGLYEDIPDSSIDDLLNLANNNSENNDENENDKIGMLFNDTDPVSDTELDDLPEESFEPEYEEPRQTAIPGAALYNKKSSSNKKLIIAAAAVVTVLAAASAVVLLKPKDDNISDLEPITTAQPENIPAANDSKKPESQENILANNAPSINNTNTTEKKTVKELKSTPAKTKPAASDSTLSVNRLVWDVPDTLSYSPRMQSYLRSAGKSIKLTLSADLLLATEYAYTNQVKVNVKLSNTGSVQEATIASSSGSTQIDEIVLQSVKDTLNVVKPPADEIKTPDFNLSLIIYF